MKLRNKKTGEIVECPMLRLSVGVCDLMRYEFPNSLAELNGEWEDYKPAEPKEPLIKDEKIRKAVRAWAEATNTSAVDYNYGDLTSLQNDSTMTFDGGLGIEDGDNYTIAELCGEEEE